MSPVSTLLTGAAVAATLLVVLWAIHLRTRDAGIQDVGWAASLGILALLYAALLEPGLPARRWLVAGLAATWSLRLSWHLLTDRVLPAGEDERYAALRRLLAEKGLPVAPLFLGFFLAQALLAAVLSIEFVLVMLHPAPEIRVWDLLGLAILAASIGGESIADRQLARWRRNPANAGRTCRRGLWRYSRHPNYFFEWLHWLAYPVIAIGAPWWWATLFAPALMLVFILWITGIPPTERQAVKSRGEDYRRYQRTTSAFFPWPPSGDSR